MCAESNVSCLHSAFIFIDNLVTEALLDCGNCRFINQQYRWKVYHDLSKCFTRIQLINQSNDWPFITLLKNLFLALSKVVPKPKQ
jgi:hypothetical protein